MQALIFNFQNMEEKKEGYNEAKAEGGFARAKALTAEERKRIAREAANTRWNTNILQANYEGVIQIGDAKLSAAVLPNGKRVVSQGTFLTAIGRSRSATGGKGVLSTVDGIPFFLQAEILKPFISEEILLSTTPIFFRDKEGRNSVGYDAELLPMVAEVYLKMRDFMLKVKKGIPKQYEKIISACDMITRGLARVGIVALVDEATGYQDVRDHQALQKILEKYIKAEWLQWTKTFPDEFYKQLFRLHNMPYPLANKGKPGYIGHWTNDIVYDRLAPALVKKLKEVNPVLPNGSRARKHHQHLTADYGQPELKKHLENIIFLMKACSNWSDFKRMLDKASPKYGNTIPMDI